MTIQIRDKGTANAQVTDKAKDAIYSWLDEYDVDREDVLLHHYEDGDFVAVSLEGVSEAVTEYNEAFDVACKEYWRNKGVHDNCFWVHREWVEKVA